MRGKEGKGENSTNSVKFFEKIETLTLYDLWLNIKEKVKNRDDVNTLNRLSMNLLRKDAEKDKYIFEQLLIRELRNDSFNKDRIIISHTEWIRNFLKDVILLQRKPSVEVDYNKCELGRILKSKKLGNNAVKNKRLLKEIDRLHRLLHIFSRKVYENIAQKNFINAYLYYTRCIKTSYSLISLLSLVKIKETSEELKRDPLTGLLNRRFLFPILKDVLELSMYTETPFSIALIDIDNFKKLNDNYGHLIGDGILKELAKVMKETLRKSDYIFRYGGEEFLVIMPATPLEDAVRVLENLRKKVESTEFKCGNLRIKITVSIGVCSDIYTGDKTPEEYILCADAKLYEAKRKGKNKVVA